MVPERQGRKAGGVGASTSKAGRKPGSMTGEIERERGVRILVIIAALVIVIGGINQAQSVLVSFLLAIFFAILGTPPVLWLERKGLPTLLAVLFVVSSMITILVGVGIIVGASINSFYHQLPVYQTRLQEQVGVFRTYLVAKGIRGMDQAFFEFVNPGAIMGLTARLFAALGSALSNIVLIFLSVTFILFAASSFPRKLRAVLGHPGQEFPQFTKFIDDFERYMVLHTLISLATGVSLGVWLSFLGVDFPILWGFLAFLFNFVPNVGSIVAAIPPILLALIQYGLGGALMTAIPFLVGNFILGNVVEPKIMGMKLGLSTLVVYLSMIFWGSLLGPVGMVLCIPLTMTLKFALENSSDTRWIAILLGPGWPEETPAAAPDGSLPPAK